MTTTDITNMSDAELDALLDRRSWELVRAAEHARMRRLSTLNRKELQALSDRASRCSPNTTHLASALAKLDDSAAVKAHARPDGAGAK